MQFNHMQVIFMLREFGGGTDPVEVTLKVIKAYANSLFCRGIRAQSGRRVFAIAGRHLPLYMIITTTFATWFGSETVLGAPAKFVSDGLGGVVEDPFGAGMCLMVVIWYALATVLSGMLYQVLHTTNLPNWAVYVASDAPLYLVAMPFAVLIMGKSSVIETRKFDMKPGQFFKLLVMCFPLMYVGSLIGNMLASLLSGGNASNSVSDLAMQFNVWNVVFLVILGPLFEEWIFRKELISRTRKYGEKTAIVFSALFFALVHMNLFQFFYAFALGLMFGYVYVRTSKLRYSVAMHMIVNFMGGVVAPWVVTNIDIDSLMNVLTSAENGDGTAMMQWMGQNATGMMIFGIYMLLYCGLIIAGVVLLIRERKNFVFYTAPEELPRGVRTSTAILNVGVITYIVVTVIITAINLMM